MKKLDNKPRVYVTRVLPKEAMDRIYENCDAKVWEGELPPPRDVLLNNVSDVEGLLSLLTDKVDAELMDRAPKPEGSEQLRGRFRQRRHR